MAHKLKIELQNSSPKIYRVVIVPENFTFDQLHLVIQCVMNWEEAHLYQFNIGAPYASDTIALPSPDTNDFWRHSHKNYDSRKTYLSDFFNGQQKKMNYVYDFGDDWKHTITPLKKPNENVLVPKCIKGENAAPVEDCGGIFGFYDLLEIATKKRKSKEELETLAWYGISKDKSYDEVWGFDMENVNEMLREYFGNKKK